MGVRSPSEIQANKAPNDAENNASENAVNEKYVPEDDETHAGVRGIEATTTVWSKKHLLAAYML